MSLADSFLADLEDIEGFENQEVTSIPTVAESITVEKFRSIIDDERFSLFLTSLTDSTVMRGQAIRLERTSAEFSHVSDASKYIPMLDREIQIIYRQVADIYVKRFPELEQIVLMPIDYLRVVNKIQSLSSLSELDMNEISAIVPANQAVAISVTASTSRGLQFLPYDETALVESRVETGLRIAEIKSRIVSYLTECMPAYAPNLSNLLGPVITAQLIAAAGGLENLASMPSQNIEAVGTHKQSLSGLSGSTAKISLVSQTDLVYNSPNDAKKRAIRLVTGKASICARVDRFGSDLTGETGSRLRSEIEASIEKTVELPPARAIKPLPVPEIGKPAKNHRGGRRARAWKEKYGLTEVQKRAGRLQFGGVEGDLDVDGTSKSSRMIEMEAGRIRATQPKKAKATDDRSRSRLSMSADGLEISLPPPPI
jgi:U4/U6 small nuclear ribonucleoprotein PRP31